MTNSLRKLVPGFMTVAVIVATLATGASGTNVAGTIAIGNTGTSTVPYQPSTLGENSSAGLAYSMATRTGTVSGWFGLPVGSTTPVALTDLPATEFAAGTFVDSTGPGPAVTTNGTSVSWEMVNGSSGATDTSVIPAADSSTYAYSPGAPLSAANGGWVAVAQATSTGHQHLVLVSTSGTLVDLGDLTTLEPGVGWNDVYGGGAGAVVVGSSGTLSEADYIQYTDPGVVTMLDLPLNIDENFPTCPTVLANNAICSAGVNAAVAPLSGSAATELTLPAGSTDITGTDGGDAVWVTSSGAVNYEPWSGGTVATVASSFGLPAVSTAVGTLGVFFGGGSTTSNAGIASFTPPATSAGAVIAITSAPAVSATELDLSPGSAMWSDDAAASGLSSGASPLWSRSLTNSGATPTGTLTAGSESLVATDASSYAFSPVVGPTSSGTRTLYLDKNGNLKLINTESSTGTTLATPTGQNDPIGFVSGSRALYETTGSSSTWELYNDVTASSAAAGLPQFAPADMWGDYIVWANTDGSIDRMDMSTPTPTTTTVLPAQENTTTGGECFVSGHGGLGVFVYGDYVAWSESCAPSSTGPFTPVAGYKDVTSGGSAVDLTSTGVPVALDQNYIAVIPFSVGFMSPGSPAALTAINLSTSAMTAVGNATGSVSLDDSTIGWIDENGEPEAAPLTTEPDQPRYLGNGNSPPGYSTTGGGTWPGEWDFSAALTACSVAITQSSTPVVTLPCNSAAMALGNADVSWNGKNTGGTTVAPGSYTWTLTSSNGSGSALSPNGGSLTLTGTIVVTATLTSTTTTLVPSANPAPLGSPVTFTATISPNPGGGTVTFSDGGTPIGSCTAVPVSSGAAGCTATYTSVASHTVTAQFSSFGTYAGSMSNAVDEAVARGTPSVGVGAAPSSTSYGTSILLTATVTGVAGATAPTGTVAMSAGSTALCTTPALSSGTASCSSSVIPAGVITIIGTFQGDTNYAQASGTTSVTVSVTPPTPPAGSTQTASGSSLSPSGTASASGGNVSASGSGVGALTVATYTGNPTTGAVSGGTGAFYDVSLGNGSTFSSVTITICNQGAGKSLKWWNGTAWVPFSNQSMVNGCLRGLVNSNTSPTEAELLGTPIAVSTDLPPGTGAYRLVASDGGIFDYGGAGFYGSTGGTPLNAPIVGMANTPDGNGYWLVASDGGIFAYGDAKFYGSTGGMPLNKPIVGMASTSDGKGYWLVASDGGIFSYGDAMFHGSTGGQVLNKPIVGMAPTPDGGGYWLVASDGGIFSYGDANFHGSAGGTVLNKPIVGMASTADGNGYWLVASDGGIFSYGDAKFYGSTGGMPLNKPIVGMASTADGNGYWLVASDGGIFSYGDAVFSGSTGGMPLNKPIVGMSG